MSALLVKVLKRIIYVIRKMTELFYEVDLQKMQQKIYPYISKPCV